MTGHLLRFVLASARTVLLTLASLEGIVGDPQLRAYQSQKVAGEIAFAQTTGLRLDAWRIRSVLPGTLKSHISADHGRVFGPSIVGKTWLLNLGGGMWWSIVELVGTSFSYHRELEGGASFTFSAGPLFSNTRF